MNDKIAEMEHIIDELQDEIKELEDKLQHANLTIAAAEKEIDLLQGILKDARKAIVDLYLGFGD